MPGNLFEKGNEEEGYMQINLYRLQDFNDDSAVAKHDANMADDNGTMDEIAEYFQQGVKLNDDMFTMTDTGIKMEELAMYLLDKPELLNNKLETQYANNPIGLAKEILKQNGNLNPTDADAQGFYQGHVNLEDILQTSSDNSEGPATQSTEDGGGTESAQQDTSNPENVQKSGEETTGTEENSNPNSEVKEEKESTEAQDNSAASNNDDISNTEEASAPLVDADGDPMPRPKELKDQTQAELDLMPIIDGIDGSTKNSKVDTTAEKAAFNKFKDYLENNPEGAQEVLQAVQDGDAAAIEEITNKVLTEDKQEERKQSIVNELDKLSAGSPKYEIKEGDTLPILAEGILKKNGNATPSDEEIDSLANELAEQTGWDKENPPVGKKVNLSYMLDDIQNEKNSTVNENNAPIIDALKKLINVLTGGEANKAA